MSKERGLTPLVGRDQELTALSPAMHRPLPPTARVQSALLVGDPGVGKSRLLYEFLARSSRRKESSMLEATCASYGRSMAYRPIVELLLRRYLGLSEGAAGEEIRSRVGRRHTSSSAWRARNVHPARPLPRGVRPAGVSPTGCLQLKERTFGVLRDVFLGA
mgnify:CR=1 FL=1